MYYVSLLLFSPLFYYYYSSSSSSYYYSYYSHCKILEAAYKICEEWAKEKGMTFNLKKSELIHFS